MLHKKKYEISTPTAYVTSARVKTLKKIRKNI